MKRFSQIAFFIINKSGRDQTKLHSAALTFSTLMSLVPLVAMGLAVLKGLGFDENFIQEIHAFLKDMPPQFKDFVDGVINMVQNTNFARLGGIGGLVLLFMVLQMMNRIEASFNQVWEVDDPRPWIQRTANYVSLVVVIPMVVVAVMSVAAKVNFKDGLAAELGALRLLVFVGSGMVFTLLYKALPHAEIRWIPAAISGAVTALLWHGWLFIYVSLQPGITNYNVIYGTLASVPVFLAWLYVSWMIVLTGAQITYAVQYEKSLGFKRDSGPFTIQQRLGLGFRLLHLAAKAQNREGDFVDHAVIANQMGLSSSRINAVADSLVHQGLLIQRQRAPMEYVLAYSAERIPLKEIVRCLLSDAWAMDAEKHEQGKQAHDQDPYVEMLLHRFQSAFGDATLADLAAHPDSYLDRADRVGLDLKAS